MLTVGFGARAGGSGSGSGTSTGGTTSTTTDGGEDNCGTCSDPRAPVEFTAPADGSEVSASTMLNIEVNYDCSCDFCGCFEDFPESFRVSVDGEQVYACNSECTGPHNVGVMLSPGQHELTATADYSFHSESDTITVTVAEAATSDTADGGSGPTTGTASSAGDTATGSTPPTTSQGADGEPPDRGCACTSTPARDTPAWGWLVLLGLAACRRRPPVTSRPSVMY